MTSALENDAAFARQMAELNAMLATVTEACQQAEREAISLRDQLDRLSPLVWNDPGKETPPFGVKILVMLGGSTMNYQDREWKAYTDIMSVTISDRSPNDDMDGSEHHDWCEGEHTDYSDFQFILMTNCQQGQDDPDADTDWYSDSIIAWAAYPDETAEVMLKRIAERE